MLYYIHQLATYCVCCHVLGRWQSRLIGAFLLLTMAGNRLQKQFQWIQLHNIPDLENTTILAIDPITKY